MTKMRFSCPLCGAKQEADNMNERAVCPCCGVPVNMERSSEWRPIVAVYAPPDVMMRRSREREAEKNHVKDERECKAYRGMAAAGVFADGKCRKWRDGLPF